MRLRFCLFFLLLSFCAGAQKKYYTYFNTDEFWQKLVRDPEGSSPSLLKDDTVLIVATNRQLHNDDQLRFISEIREPGQVRFYLVYARGVKWHLSSQPSLRAAVSKLPAINKDWVVYTEGMGKIFTTDLDRGISMAGQYGVNVLLLDYPSIRSNYKPLRNYWFVMHNSRAAHHDFVPVIDSLRFMREQQMAGNGRLTLFFHSMGNNVMLKLAKKSILNRLNTSIWVDNLVLNAPCVPSAGSTDWINSIRFAKRVYVHYNPNDFTLKWARLASFHSILGERPDPPLSRSAVYVNFSPLCGNGHSNFLNLYGRPPVSATAIDYYQTVLHGGAAKLNSVHLRPGSYRQGTWDLIP